MTNALAQRLSRLANWKVILSLVVLVIVFNRLLFLPRTARLVDLSGIQEPIIDVLFSYSPQAVYAIVAGLGDQGRQIYIVTQLTVDLVFPILYSLLLALLIFTIFRKAFAGAGFLQKAIWLPLIGALFDYGENFGIVAMLVAHPNQPALLAQVTSLFSSAKWVTLLLAVGLFLFGLAVWISKGIRKPQSALKAKGP